MISALRPHWALAVVVGAFVFCATLVSKTQVLATQDLYLHISVGRWIMANGQIPDHDIFSWSMPGTPWLAHEWLASAGWALLYDHLGWGGVLAATALLLALAIGVLTLDIARTLGPVGALSAAVLAWGLSLNHLVARPHVAALPLVVIWMVAHVRARHGDSVPPLYLVPVMTLWANLHGSFMFGLAFTVLFAVEAVFEAETMHRARAAVLRWSIFLGAACLAAIVTPHGLTGFLFPFHLMSMSDTLGNIGEWRSSSISNNAPLLFWCFLLIFVSLWRGVRLPVCRLAMFMVLLYMAFAHTRHTELLGLAAPILLQHAIATQISPAASFFSNWGAFARPAVRASFVAIALSASSIATLVLCRDLIRGPDRITPTAALAAVEARGIRGPVLNSYNFGGYLIFRGYAPFIDGRADMYGNEFMSKYLALDQLTALLERYHIAWTIFEPANPRAILMDELPGWSRLYADSTAVVHLRQAAPRH